MLSDDNSKFSTENIDKLASYLFHSSSIVNLVPLVLMDHVLKFQKVVSEPFESSASLYSLPQSQLPLSSIVNKYNLFSRGLFDPWMKKNNRDLQEAPSKLI